ncbi:MAG: hypothetical protein V5A62_03220 [Haloarculaceae archaeon]
MVSEPNVRVAVRATAFLLLYSLVASIITPSSTPYLLVIVGLLVALAAFGAVDVLSALG